VNAKADGPGAADTRLPDACRPKTVRLKSVNRVF